MADVNERLLINTVKWVEEKMVKKFIGRMKGRQLAVMSSRLVQGNKRVPITRTDFWPAVKARFD